MNLENLENHPNFIADFKKADSKIFEFVIKKYQNKIFNIVLNILKNRTDAEDLTQKVFLKIFEKRMQFNGRSSFYTWIYRIAINESLNEFKKTKKNGVYIEEIIADENGAFQVYEEKLEKDELQKKFDKIFNKLPDKYRIILTLKDFEKMSYNEISETLNISLDKVKVWIFRGRENLRKLIESEGQDLL